MYFLIVDRPLDLPKAARTKAFLVNDRWDDYGFRTLYGLHIFDDKGSKFEVGHVKIGQFGMKEGRTDVPLKFDKLDEDFFSLGQDDSYYETLNAIGAEVRERVLKGLRDCAHNHELFLRAQEEEVTKTSLLRSVSPRTVTDQFSRMTLGGARLTNFSFSYSVSTSARLEFVVRPNSNPPTNIHVLIGRNGVGKTTILHGMTEAILQGEHSDSGEEHLSIHEDKFGKKQRFSRLVSVAFSAFDAFRAPLGGSDGDERIEYVHVGLSATKSESTDHSQRPKSQDELTADFCKSAKNCRLGARFMRWQRALRMLETDPIFRDAKIREFATETEASKRDPIDNAGKLFQSLSAGHKIVLLTTTKLVESVAEKTLVLFDEPESHLHPPLLSAFIRALSELLIDRNAVAIMATHSPVALQEVPRSCVWKVMRSGKRLKTVRPQLETFGENVGTLTREAFGLEVDRSGFHSLVSDVADAEQEYDAVVKQFEGQLGSEARALVRARLAQEDS